MDEVVSEFLIESHENLNQLDHDLVELEKDRHSADLLASVFRTFHTMKGVSGFLNFARLERLAHAAEDMLSKLRDGALTLDEEITSALLASVDAVRQMLAAVEAAGNDGEADYPELIARLHKLTSGEHAAAAPEFAPKDEAPAKAAPEAPAAAETAAHDGAAKARRKKKNDPAPEPAAEPEPPLQAVAESPAPAPQAKAEPAPQAKPEPVTQPKPEPVPQLKAESLAQPKPEPVPPPKPEIIEPPKPQVAPPAPATVERKPQVAPPPAAKPAQSEHPDNAADSMIRVNVNLLDKLMNLVGELVLVRNQILQFSTGQQESAFLAQSRAPGVGRESAKPARTDYLERSLLDGSGALHRSNHDSRVLSDAYAVELPHPRE